MYTAKSLLETSLKHRLVQEKARCLAAGYAWTSRREPDTVFGTVMSSDEIDAALARQDPDLLLSAQGVSCISNREVFFFSDDGGFGHGVLPRGFMAFSVRMPHLVAPRPAVPSGLICSAAELIAVYCEGERQLHSLDDLVSYLNRHQ